MRKVIDKLNEKRKKIVEYIEIEKLFRSRSVFSESYPTLTDLWKRRFFQMVRFGSTRTKAIAKEFLTVEIKKINENRLRAADPNNPILICVIKNDLKKIKKFMEHYRKLGIKNFVFLDNMSSDGTREFLTAQEDTLVYSCEHEYRSERRVAWINRLIAECGDNRWYLIVDSDEFISYIGCGEYTLEQVTQRAEELGYTRVEGFFLDMYSKESLFEANLDKEFWKQYCYMDKDTYSVTELERGKLIRGGPRTRLFGKLMQLSKFPLFYFEGNDIVPSAHYMIPFEKSRGVPIALAILHYKFVDGSDYQKLQEAVEKGIYNNNSEDYRQYLKIYSQNEGISFYDEQHSIVYSEENLQQIELLESLF